MSCSEKHVDLIALGLLPIMWSARLTNTIIPQASLTLPYVSCNDPLPDVEHIWIVRIDVDFDPMMVWDPENLEPGEVFDGRQDRRALNSRGKRLVGSEEVTVE